MSENTDWEALLAAEGYGDIDESIREGRDVHTGVGRAAMVVAGEDADRADFDEDNEQFDLESFLDSED